MSQSLTLYDLSQELVSLMDAWDDPETSPEARAEIEVQLRAYADAHVQKVDDLRNYMRHLAVMETALREEAATQKARADACKARLEWLKGYCCDVMVQHKAKRWDGRTGSLLCKGNGGKQPVTITDESMVPDEFCVYEGTVPALIWQGVVAKVMRQNESTSVKMVRTPRKSLIEAELQKPCPNCVGGMMPSGVFIVPIETAQPCSACGGSGKRGVPGCTLLPRGSHLEIK